MSDRQEYRIALMRVINLQKGDIFRRLGDRPWHEVTGVTPEFVSYCTSEDRPSSSGSGGSSIYTWDLALYEVQVRV